MQIGAAVLAAGLALSTASCGLTDGCTLVGCTDGRGMSATIFTARSMDELGVLDGATIEICHNDVCTGGPVPHAEAGTTVTELYEDPVHTSAGAGLWSMPDGSFELGVGFFGAVRAFADGDRFSAVLWSASGDVLFQGTWVASFERYYPNGESCDEDTTQCWSTDLQPVMR